MEGRMEMEQQNEVTEKRLIADATKGMKLREAAEWLNQGLPKNVLGRVTHMTVKNWLDGVYKPSDESIRAWILYYPAGDVRHQLGLNITLRRMRVLLLWMGDGGR